MNNTVINNAECSSGFDLLAYVYGEMRHEARDAVDSHLEMCGLCVEELAELSQSRFPVYEWKRTEFDAAVTPSVVIPYADITRAGWFDSLRAIFAMRPTLAAAGIIALVTTVGIWTVLTSSLSGPDEVVRVDASTEAQVKAAEPVKSPVSTTTDLIAIEAPAPPAVVNVKNEPEVNKRKPANRRDRTERSTRPPVVREVPVLIQADEDVDDSLRLSDIFDEVDTSS